MHAGRVCVCVCVSSGVIRYKYMRIESEKLQSSKQTWETLHTKVGSGTIVPALNMDRCSFRRAVSSCLIPPTFACFDVMHAPCPFLRRHLVNAFHTKESAAVKFSLLSSDVFHSSGSTLSTDATSSRCSLFFSVLFSVFSFATVHFFVQASTRASAASYCSGNVVCHVRLNFLSGFAGAAPPDI